VHESIVDVSVMDLIEEPRRLAIAASGASSCLDTSARDHPKNTGVTFAIA
jgi:hypothetical protein